MRIGLPSALATAAAVVLVTTGLGAGPVSAPPAPAVPGATGPRSPWTQLSSGQLQTSTSIALGRFGGDLQVVWPEAVGTKEGLYTRILSAAGTPRTAALRVLPSAWQTINSFPAIIPNAGGRLLTFSGLRTTDTSDPYSGGYQYYLTSRDGKTWTLANGTLSTGNKAYGSYGTDATVVAGQPFVAFTAATASRISYNLGVVAPIPTAPADDPTTSDTGNDAYYTGVGTDARSTQTWAVWYSNSGARTTEGVQAQRILPSLGPLVQGPQSAQRSNGSYASVAVNERIVVSERTAAAGGGLYAGYAVGYPVATRVALWRVGAGALMAAGGGNVQVVGTAAGPGGRIWLYWWDANAAVINVLRTNAAGTRFGALTQVPTPHASTAIWDLEGDAAGGPLQLVVNSGESQQQIFSAVVKPRLSVTASPTTFTAVHGGHLTVTVSDAGAPVPGAAVRFGGHQMVTGAIGRVVFTVAKGSRAGHYPVVISAAGYAPAALSVSVH